MLKRLNIRNYALIESLEIEFAEGLTIITGETGAGKSILLGALGLVMGDRAESKVFYNEDEKCVVEALFDVKKYDLREFFAEHDLDEEDELTVRRELSPSGKSRAFVNDTPVNNAVLRRLTDALIDLHQQFDTLDIHEVNFQLRMVDALAGNQDALAAYTQEYRQYRAAAQNLRQIREQSAQDEKNAALYRFQLDELLAAELREGELETLEAELARLNNAEEIKRAYGAAFNLLAESELSVAAQLRDLARTLAPTSRLAPALAALNERLIGLIAETDDLATECERISENTELDPQRIAEAQQRLNTLYKLQQKHGVAQIADLIALQEDLTQRCEGFARLDDQIAELESRVAQLEKSLWRQAETLRQRRRAAIPDFETRVSEMLRQLSMPHARLKIDLRDAAQLGPSGADDVQFLFAGNAGSRFLPIKDAASGGELARLTLCAKSLVADAIPLPTLIFDEIDTGVSGDVSLRMGHILRELSARHQVVSITHTPQVAARAHKHYFVYKKTNGQRSATHVRLLSSDERLRAIAAMLSGNPPSEAALTTARELVEMT